MAPPTLTGIGVFAVSIHLRRHVAGGPVDGRRLDFTLPAPSHCVAKVIGAELGRTIVASLRRAGAAEAEAWTFDPDRDVTAAPVGEAGPTGAEHEAARADAYARVLTALVARHGPLKVTEEDVATAVPADLIEAQAAEGGDVWFVTPHPDRPGLPESGLVAASDLEVHRGRYVLVPTDLTETNPLGPSSWSWRVIIGVREHATSGHLMVLRTPAGEQPVTRAGLLSVREAR